MPVRSITTGMPDKPDIEWKIGMHQPMQTTPALSLVPKGDPHPVVELWKRNDHGEWARITSYSITDFVEQARDIAGIARDLGPATDGEDQDSNEATT